MDREGWGQGPWDDEPDEVDFRARLGRLPAVLRRNMFGAWCGYVGVPAGHPYYGLVRGNESVQGLRVHGAVTFAARIEPLDGSRWWFGFDTNHGWDYAPGLMTTLRGLGLEESLRRLGGAVTYRTADYARSECEKLALQLAIVGQRGASVETLVKRVRYGGRKGRAAWRRIRGLQ